MRNNGYTLIELLVVISVIAILSVVGFVNFKDFSSSQIAPKAVGQIQSLMRLAQSNATSSTVCSGVGGATWSIIIKDDKKTIDLACGLASPYSVQKSYILENVQVDSIKGSDCATSIGFPVTFSYSTGIGTLTVSPSNSCLTNASLIVLTIKNVKDATKQNSFTVSKAGAINVQ